MSPAHFNIIQQSISLIHLQTVHN